MFEDICTARVGILGCGQISDAYLLNAARESWFTVAACADRDFERAKDKAGRYTGVRALQVDELFADDTIEAILNLTPPAAHAEVNLRALRSGKTVYTEKPYATTLEAALEVNAEAATRGLRAGCAPDTFLGGSHQTARKLLDDGAIGTPIAGVAFMASHGVESWHPAPEFFYKPGGGPLFDMGPYYITNLVQLLGPAKSVQAMATKGFATRTISSEPLAGALIEVEVPTHYSGDIEFVSGAVVTVLFSFDVWAHDLPRMELYGTEGTLHLSDPNHFGDEIFLKRRGEERFSPAFTHGYTENSRGVGLADLLAAALEGRDHRCNERLATHVLDIMHALDRSGESRAQIGLTTSCERPEPMPTSF